MNIVTLLEMSADVLGGRVAVVSGADRVTYAELLDRSRRGAERLRSSGADHLALVAENSAVVPTALFAAALAGRPFAPLNYRLDDLSLRTLVERLDPSLVVADDVSAPRVGSVDGAALVSPQELIAGAPLDVGAGGAGDVAVLLFTSGTTGEPKAAVLRHQNLSSYVLSTVEPFSAADDDAALVSVPPYHVAGIAAILSSVCAGRRIVYLPSFSAEAWVDTVVGEGVTHAMVVPTMLRRVLEIIEERGIELGSLRHLSYGGGRMPQQVVEQAMRLLPEVGLVNAYGLTETSSTITVLSPQDHREAAASDDPDVRRRLTSVGRPLPGVDVQVRLDDGDVAASDQVGEIWVRGDQVAGEYVDQGSVLVDGWFPTRDGGRIDQAGFLYVEGRMDDVIVRGGENMSPGEIEEVILDHPAVADVAVIGVPDVEWGEAVVAVVVARHGVEVSSDDLAAWAGARLRSARTPQRFVFRDELPHNETGKVLRRVLRAELAVAP